MGIWYALNLINECTLILIEYSIHTYVYELIKYSFQKILESWRPNNDRAAVILADSAYPLKSWLITPNIPGHTGRGRGERRPLSIGMQRFLSSFRKTRFIVENSLGILKNEFPVLKYGFRIKEPQKISAITLACVALHNIQNEHRHGRYDEEFLREIEQENLGNNDEDQRNGFIQDDEAGRRRQMEFIHQFE